MDFDALTLEALRLRAAALRRDWSSRRPFRYLIVDDFLPAAFAEAILAAYPNAGASEWDDTTYIHQRGKLTQCANFPAPISRFFALTASRGFRDLISEITGIRDLIDDCELVGGGLHQTLRGGFLDVHVDYNIHPRTKLYRRLNLLLYMNKDWRPEYAGHLELWDMRANRQLASVSPDFNRAVLFETTEHSYHGHPRPLNVPPHVARKSLAIYYYTEASGVEVAPEHNTIYRQTTGARGYVKTFAAAARALQERLGEQRAGAVCKDLARRTYRRLQGLPPENK